MSTPVGCALWIDGELVADGSQPDDGSPVALSGLRVTWGRATTVDQPEPSTATFDLVNPDGGDSFVSLLYAGARVDITAAGTVPAPATLPINIDPSFEAAAVGSDPFGHYGWSGLSAVVADRAATGAHSARLALDWPAAPILVAGGWLPPAPYDDLDPAAWDDIPRMLAGEEWSAAATVQSPVAGSMSVYLYGFPSPRTTSAANYPYLAGGQASAGTGPGEPVRWQTIRVPDRVVASGAVGMWAGLLVRLQVAAWNSIGPMVGGQPNPIAWGDAVGSWNDWSTGYIDDVLLLAPSSAGEVHRGVLVFSGRITDLDAGWDFQAGATRSSVVAADFTADLANRDVADQPWPAETLAARFAHVVAAAGVAVPYTLAPSLTGYRVSWMDVDRQQCWPLLADLATSVDGVLWSAAHPTTGPYLWLADPRVQSALYQLAMGDAGLVVIVPTAAGNLAIELDSCDLLLDPVVFRQAVSDISTRVAITWLEQTVDDAGQPAPTERTDVYTDPAAELANGTRRLGISTVLTGADDAAEVAALLLGRLHRASWRVAGLTWRTDKTAMDGDQTARTLDLLDGSRRLAAALLLTNLPAWAPAGPTLPLLLQGGAYTFEDGQWTLDLVTSSAAAQGTGLPWNAVDATWAWNEFDPAIDWTDLVGVAP